MTCAELVELVTDYLEDSLPLESRRRFEEHLAACGPCRRYLVQMRETLRLSGRLGEESISPAARDALLSVFRDWKQQK
jgi:predicted anti-sigma-YlaC factor YlaD